MILPSNIKKSSNPQFYDLFASVFFYLSGLKAVIIKSCSSGISFSRKNFSSTEQAPRYRRRHSGKRGKNVRD
jgi:hypothetical protein